MRWLPAFLIFVIAAATPVGAEISLFGLKNSLFQFALDQISVPGEMELKAEGVEDADDGATDIIGLTVGDAQGVWLKVGRISLRWNASRIVRGELEITRLAASDVEVLRPPTSSSVSVEVKPESELAETDNDPFDWPRSPITTRIDELVAERVSIAPGVIAAQSLDIDLTGALQDEGDQQSLTLNITRTDTVEGRIFLDFLRDFATDRLTLKLNADEAAGGLVAELAGLPAGSASRVDLSGDGPLSNWALTLDASADDVFTATGSGALNTVGRLAARFDMTVTPGDALDPQVAAALSPNARIIADVAEDDGGFVRIRQGSFTTRDVTVTASGQYSQTDAAADFDVTAQARPGLARLVEGVDFGGLTFDGAVRGPVDDLAISGDVALTALKTETVDVGSATLNADLRFAGDLIEAAVTGQASDLRIDRLTPDLLGTAMLDIDLRKTGDMIALSKLNFESPAIRLIASGGADLAADTLSVRYDLTTPDMTSFAAAYDVNANGAGALTGALTGEVSAPTLKGDAAFTGLAFEGEPLGEVRIAHDATFGSAPSGQINLTADGSRFGPVTFDGGFLLNGPDLRLSDLTATGLGALIVGDVAVDMTTTLAEGALRIDAPDLSQLSAVAGQAISGAIDGDLRLSAADAMQNAALNIALTDLRAAGVTVKSMSAEGDIADALGAARFDLTMTMDRLDAGQARVASGRISAKGAPDDVTIAANLSRITSDAATIADATLDATVREGLGGDPQIDAVLTARDIGAGPARLTTSRLTAAGRLSNLRTTLKSSGGLNSGAALTLDAAADINAIGPVAATVSRLSATLDEAKLNLEKPLEIARANGATRFKGIDLSLSTAALTGDVTLYADGASGALDLRAGDLAPLAAPAGLPVERGAAYISADFNTRRSGAGAKVTLNASDVRFSDAIADIGALTIDGAVDWDGRVADVTAAISGPFGDPVRARIAAPLRPSGGPAPTLAQNGPLSGAIDWSGEIGKIWALIPAPGHVLSGATRVALSLGGTPADPKVGGDVKVTDGRYENLDVGTILVDLAAVSRIEPDGAFAVDLTATDGSGGDVTATVSLADGRIDARVTSTEATLVRRDDVTAALSLDITAAGPLAAPDIAGVVTIDRAEVRLVNANPPGVADIGDVRFKGEDPPEPEPQSGGDIDLDVAIKGPQDIFVRGRGLDSEWEIDLKVSGTAADPRIVGAIQKRRGQLSLLGRDFDLERGKIQFNGGKGVDPRLDILIQRENDGIRGGIAVTGTASDPQINFVSRPALAEEEVLPRILFGRSSQSLSPSDALSLAVGVATLLDGGGGAIDGARGAVGLDVLRVDTGDAGPSVTVGSNVADGVFVGAKQPIGSGSASVTVEVEVFDNITIDSEFGPDVGTSIGLNWKKDF